MSNTETLQGLNCPNCGGMVPIPEGQVIVHCPFCEMRSFVRGQRGIRRYQVPQQISKEAAIQSAHHFFSSSLAIAPSLRRQAQINETFLVYLPFWTVWGRVTAWIFGEEKVGSGDHKRYEPREVRLVKEMTWTGAACDVGEFGVNQINLTDQPIEPFNPDALHAAGMVFEPVNSFSEARNAAESQFEADVRKNAGVDRISQFFMRLFRSRTGLVYYPLWVLRYLYRGRAYQVVVDGYSGLVLYGKAPGNILYRAAVLVAGMAFGALVSVDGSAAALYYANDDNSNSVGIALFLLIMGLGLMYAAYRAFRYGEVYEYRRLGPKRIAGLENPFETIARVKDIEKWINRLG